MLQVINEDGRHVEGAVSCWRSIFIANAFSKLSTARRASPTVSVIILVRRCSFVLLCIHTLLAGCRCSDGPSWASKRQTHEWGSGCQVFSCEACCESMSAACTSWCRLVSKYAHAPSADHAPVLRLWERPVSTQTVSIVRAASCLSVRHKTGRNVRGHAAVPWPKTQP